MSAEDANLDEVSGKHLSGKGIEDVKIILIDYGLVGLNLFPKNLEKVFPGLVYIVFVNGSLTSVTAEDLKPFPNLLGFVMRNFKLSSLDADLFKYNPLLHVVDFCNNSIETVGAGIFNDLKNLDSAFFSGNICIDFDAKNVEEVEELKQKLAAQCLTKDSALVVETAATVNE